MDSSNKKILIFDDDEDIVSICTYILEEQGWDVKSYNDVNEVEERVRAFDPALILMDNWIPDEGGIVATQKLKRTGSLKHIPVIYFSANSEIKGLMEEAGADNLLAKPFDMADLDHIISVVLNQTKDNSRVKR